MKNTNDSRTNRNDDYKMLTYLTATELTNGVLIYAGVEVNDEAISIGSPGQKIHIISLDFSADDARAALIEKSANKP